jgi:hypothetical protein
MLWGICDEVHDECEVETQIEAIDDDSLDEDNI